MGTATLEDALVSAEALAPADGLETVALLRARLERLEAVHVERALREGWSWRRIAERLGVTKQAMHKKHARRIAERLAAEARAERRHFVVTGRARLSVRAAREEASALGAEAVGPEHLLLGLLHEDEGPVARALEAAGVTLDAARRQANGNGVVPRRRSADDEPGRLPVAPEARAAMEESLREAVRRGDTHLGVEHLLLALLHDAEGPAASLLVALGAAPDGVERLLDERLAAAVPD